jgi:hypothetical protein
VCPPLRSFRMPIAHVGQTGAHLQSDLPGPPSDQPSAVCCALDLRSWLCDSTKGPSGFAVNHYKPLRLGATSTPIPLMNWLPRSSRIDLGFVAQPRNHSRLHLALLATMWSALDPVGHQIPQTKPTCLPTPWRTYRHKPFVLVLHLHQRKSGHYLRLQY